MNALKEFDDYIAICDELGADYCENDVPADAAYFAKLAKAVAEELRKKPVPPIVLERASSRTLPKNEYGEIITSANYGYATLVKVLYNTDVDGKWVGDNVENDHPYTLHGPFENPAEANEWIEAYPDDTDVFDMEVILMNKVRP
jgi:hypothetical protein